MTAKKINELSAKTPVSTDLIPVADPTTGVAGKSTAQQVYDASLSTAFLINYTGTASPINSFLVAPKMAVQSEGVATIPNGVAIETLNINNAFSTTLSFDNLVGTNSLINLTFCPNLTSASFPNLVYVGGSFTVNNNLTLVNFSIPQLRQVLGTFGYQNASPISILSAPNLRYVGAFNPNVATLTTISMPELTVVGGSLSITFTTALTSISFPKLSYIYGTFQVSNVSACTSISLPNLVHVGAFSVSGLNAVPSISFPELVSCGGNFTIASDVGLTNISSLSAPKLQYVRGAFQPQGMYGITSLSMPALKFIGTDANGSATASGLINIIHLNGMTSFTLPAIEAIAANTGLSIRFEGFTNALTTFTLGSNLRWVDGGVNMISCALNQASVDGLLVRLAALDGTGVTTAYSSKTVTITGTSATPSATGLAAKAILVARGCTVTHN